MLNEDGFECPGSGKCHGCLNWCCRCGDVDEMCEGPVCWQHRCQRCNAMFLWEEREFLFDQGGRPGRCFACEIRNAMDIALGRLQSAIARGDETVLENEVEAGERRASELAPYRRSAA